MSWREIIVIGIVINFTVQLVSRIRRSIRTKKDFREAHLQAYLKRKEEKEDKNEVL